MKGEHIMSTSKKKTKSNKSMKSSSIDYSDIPELDASFWKRAKLIRTEPKTAISLRVDGDVLRWFKAQGDGYQSLMNAVLKTYAEAKKGSQE